MLVHAYDRRRAPAVAAAVAGAIIQPHGVAAAAATAAADMIQHCLAQGQHSEGARQRSQRQQQLADAPVPQRQRLRSQQQGCNR
jgi:hypothetical protein